MLQSSAIWGVEKLVAYLADGADLSDRMRQRTDENGSMTGKAAHAGNGLLFVAGSGRSGSTLLEQLLAERLGGLAVGEVRFFFGYYDRGDIPCGCGALLSQCGFWGPIGRRLREHFDFARVETERRRLTRIRSLLIPGAVRRLRREDRELNKAYRELYRLITQRSEGRVVIDSSKMPTHLVILRGVLTDAFATVHLVRDPRAVAWAFCRRVKRDPASPQRGGLMLQRSIPVALAGWAMENSWTRRLLRSFDPWMLLRYEDLVRSPRYHVDDVVRRLGLPCEPEPRRPMLHSVGGNPVRFRREPRTIREDREWVESSGRVYRLLTGLLVYPLLHAFGYPLESKRLDEVPR